MTAMVVGSPDTDAGNGADSFAHQHRLNIATPSLFSSITPHREYRLGKRLRGRRLEKAIKSDYSC